MKQKDNLLEANIMVSVKKYLDIQVENGEISKFCAILSQKLVMKSIQLETYQQPFKSSGVLQLKTNFKLKNI